MKIQLMSDLHLETQPGFQPRAARDAELLILAGDIGSYQRGSRLADPDFGLGRFSPKHGWPCPVFFVPGNHEYDNMDFDEAHARLRETCDRLGITWLEREVIVCGHTRFIGTSLWADFDALVTDELRADPIRVERTRGKAFRAANFYLAKTGTTRNGKPWMAEGWREQALICEAWLRDALSIPFEGTTVVVTHFAPSLHSADPRYGLTPGTAGFCNSLDELTRGVQWWLHGHLHFQQQYELNGCRVVANPLGYARKGEQEGFHAELVLDLTTRAGIGPYLA